MALSRTNCALKENACTAGYVNRGVCFPGKKLTSGGAMGKYVVGPQGAEELFVMASEAKTLQPIERLSLL